MRRIPHNVPLALILILLSFRTCESFVATPKIRLATRLILAAAHRVELVLTDDRVLDVASFRNGLCNPAMMVERQQAKQDSIDRTESALNGLKIGLLFIGPPFAIYQWYSSGSIQDGLIAYVTLGGTSGIMLALNNYLGKGIYVPTEAEATNRILVDYAEGLKRRQDVGFVAISEDSVFVPAHGVMACADAQWRNSPSSPPGTQSVAGYPPHLHIKNMLVHEDMRRKGVGNALIDAFDNYAKEDTDAELLTLEVEDSNVAAVNLYESAGFEQTKNPTAFTKRTFMVKPLSNASTS